MNDKTSDDRAQRAIPAMTGAVNLLDKLLSSDDIKTSHKASLRTVLAYITDVQQRAIQPAAAQEAVALIENARAATDFSTNYATAKPDIGNTEKEHILGLCRVVTGLVAHIEAAPVAAAPVDTWFADQLTAMGEVIPLASTPAAPGIDLSKLQRYRMASDTKDVRNLYKDDTGTWVKIQDVERALIDASPKGGSDVQMVGEVLVTVSGFTGSGKSAVAGEIEILCKALGLDVEWVDSEEEKRLTHADWTSDLELFKPRVRIVERNIPRPPMQATSAEVSE